MGFVPCTRCDSKPGLLVSGWASLYTETAECGPKVVVATCFRLRRPSAQPASTWNRLESLMGRLESATITLAKVVGKGSDLGLIDTGKIADLVLLDANPLDDVSNT